GAPRAARRVSKPPPPRPPRTLRWLRSAAQSATRLETAAPTQHSRRPQRPYPLQLSRDPITFHLEVVVALQVDPELGRRAEVPREPQSRVGADAALSVHDLVDAPRRHPDRHGYLVLADSERHKEVLHEHFAGVDGRQLIRRTL